MSTIETALPYATTPTYSYHVPTGRIDWLLCSLVGGFLVVLLMLVGLVFAVSVGLAWLLHPLSHLYRIAGPEWAAQVSLSGEIVFTFGVLSLVEICDFMQWSDRFENGRPYVHKSWTGWACKVVCYPYPDAWRVLRNIRAGKENTRWDALALLCAAIGIAILPTFLLFGVWGWMPTAAYVVIPLATLVAVRFQEEACMN